MGWGRFIYINSLLFSIFFKFYNIPDPENEPEKRK